ncbi:MAG: helix-turn-helix domain-containing protein [Alphaproteobacteria bacterium]
MNYDLLHIQGKPFVLVPLHDYREISGTKEDASLPSDILDALTAAQDSPVKIIRKHRGFTQEELAIAAGISRSYLTEIETGTKEGSLRTMKALALALKVDLNALV